MARLKIGGIGIEYELLGGAGSPAVAITPGGRFSMDSPGIREMGEALARAGKRVLLWDRPNCGASDICFEGESEGALHADTLLSLIRELDLGPTALIGGSAGARVALLAAVREPSRVSHLALWWVSGGLLSMMSLGAAYCADSALVASMIGMEGVAQMPLWAEQIRRNPGNREYLLRQERWAFIRQMERWASAFVPRQDASVASLRCADLARITMPVLIFRGSETDLYHPRSVGDELQARLGHSRLVEAPWPDDVFARRFQTAIADGSGIGHFLDWPELVPQILEFLDQTSPCPVSTTDCQ